MEERAFKKRELNLSLKQQVLRKYACDAVDFDSIVNELSMQAGFFSKFMIGLLAENFRQSRFFFDIVISDPK